jgi:hypothetical protein
MTSFISPSVLCDRSFRSFHFYIISQYISANYSARIFAFLLFSLSNIDSLVTTMTEEIPDPTSHEAIPRQVRSALLEYNDSILPSAEDHLYSPLATNKTRIRLLRLHAGVIEDPTVTCQIFEAEFLQGQASPSIVDSYGNLTNIAIEYEALSWRWSDETQSPHSIIVIGSDGKARKKRVSRTLGLAMKYLRCELDRILWIDAICINQNDMEERSSQVSIMSLIYTHAQRVCVWLGEHDDDSRNAITFIRQVSRAATHGDVEYGDDPVHIPMWRAFLAFMQREWFTRRWVVQEIVMAARASVYCGSDELQWQDLAIAVVVFEHLAYVPHLDERGLVTNWFESMSQLRASILLKVSSKAIRMITTSGYIEKQPESPGSRSLEYLVTSLADFECQQPHDHVYALIAMAEDAFPTPPTFSTDYSPAAIMRRVFSTTTEQAAYPVDYNCKYSDFCKTFVEFCVRMCAKYDPGQALDVLCRPWAKDWQPRDTSIQVTPNSPKEKGSLDMLAAQVEPAKDEKVPNESMQPQHQFDSSLLAHLFADKRQRRSKNAEFGLPSWVATIEKAPFRNASHAGKIGAISVEARRNNADPLVDSPGKKYPMYNAGGSKPIDYDSLRFKTRELHGHCSLYVKGFCFDRVASVSQPSRAGAIPRSWFDLGNWPEARTVTERNKRLLMPPAAFWRTLVADRDEDGCAIRTLYKQGCKEIAAGGQIKDDTIDFTHLIHGRPNTNIAAYCRRVQSVIWNRVLVKTKKGALGLVSEGVQKGDLICVLYGCTVPVILRQENARFKTENEHNDELLEDGMEAMKRLVAQLRRYRERKLRYSEMSEQERAEIKKHTANYNKEHTVKKNMEKIEKHNTEDEDLEMQRKLWFGRDDPQSDIDSEDDIPDIEEDDALQDKPEDKEQLTDEQKLKIEQDEAAQKQRKKDTAKETPKRHQERQYKAKIRDSLRYYRFLDQAYIHGMMDGEAVDHKLRSGRPDHVFEIR